MENDNCKELEQEVERLRKLLHLSYLELQTIKKDYNIAYHKTHYRYFVYSWADFKFYPEGDVYEPISYR